MSKLTNNDDNPENNSSQIYHEKQSKLMCAIHALNNLLQYSAFDKKRFDEFCLELSPDYHWLNNPHRNCLGLGNYDINILMRALSEHDLEIVWFDKRKSIESLNTDHIYGFLINIPSPFKLGILTVPFYEGKHWLAIKLLTAQDPRSSRSDGDINLIEAYFNLDSKLSKPEIIGTTKNDLLTFFSNLLTEKPETQIILVVTKEIAKNQTWLSINE